MAGRGGGRAGHVSRTRLFAEGSVLARRLQEQREQAAAQQAAAAAAATPAANPQQARHDGVGEDLEDQERAQITWPELYDARTTAAYVGAELGQQEHSHKAMQLWWPPHSGPGHNQQQVKRRHSRLLHYSAVLSRVLQRSGSAPQPRTQAARGAGGAGAAAGGVAGSGISLTVTTPHELFGPPAKRPRLQQQTQTQGSGSNNASGSEGAAAWVCCNTIADDGGGAEAPSGPWVCGASNAGSSSLCGVCGAPRWDGPDGQAQARISAALQTADLDATSVRQVAARVVSESGSRPGIGLLPQAGMQAEVLAVVHARKTHTAGGGSRSMPPGALIPAAAAGAEGGHAPAAGAAGGGGAGAAGVDDLELLEQYGCLPEAHGVYTALMTCLQQQQQQQSAAGSEVRLQTAAAAAAALAPGLLGSVLRQQGGLPAFKLEQGSILAWVNDCFEEAAEAAVQAAARNTVQNQQQQPCTGMRRPLPLHTLLAVCDRRGAALRQQLADAAAGSVHACGGRLPLITRRYVLEGHELLSQQVAPREWLWAHWGADTHSSRVLRAREGRRERRRRAGSKDGGSSGSDSDGGGSDGGSEDDVEVVESIVSQDWEEVLFVRGRVMQLLSAWHDTLVQQQAAGGQQTQQKQQQKQLQPLPYRRRAKALDRQLCKLLGQQVQQINRGWGSAPAWALRQGLGQHVRGDAAGGQAAMADIRQQRQQQRQQKQQQGSQAAAAAAGPSAAATGAARRSARLKAQSDGGGQGPTGMQGVVGASGAGGGIASSSSEEMQEDDSSSDAEEWLSNDDDGSKSQQGRQRGQQRSKAGGSRQGTCSPSPPPQQRGAGHADGVQQRQQPCGPDGDDSNSALQVWMDSLDDLLLPPQQQLAAPAAGRPPVGLTAAVWQPRGGSHWKAFSPPGANTGLGAAAATAHQGRGAGGSTVGGGGSRGGGRGGGESPSLWSGLPAGMQVVLSQAGAAGVAPQVLQRTAARLGQLVAAGNCNTAQ